MLRKETISGETLDLLNKLMIDQHLKDFFLVGGTALALRIGHRLSMEIALFSTTTFDLGDILSHMEANYPFKLDFKSRNTLKGEAGGIKIDLITHAYPLVNPLLVMEGIRMASLEDIAAMKLNAIAGNGTRLKDFIDTAYLSTQLSLNQMVSAYEKKYSSRNPTIVVKALDYHKEINFEEKVNMIDGGLKWKDIETRLRLMTIHPQQVFDQRPGEKKALAPKRKRGLGR